MNPFETQEQINAQQQALSEYMRHKAMAQQNVYSSIGNALANSAISTAPVDAEAPPAQDLRLLLTGEE